MVKLPKETLGLSSRKRTHMVIKPSSIEQY